MKKRIDSPLFLLYTLLKGDSNNNILDDIDNEWNGFPEEVLKMK